MTRRLLSVSTSWSMTRAWARVLSRNIGLRPRGIPTVSGGDFALTPEGKKVVKLPNGGDVIQWHPTTVKDPNYNIIVVSVAANHLRARDLKTIDDATVPGFTNAKGVDFSEAVSLDGVPAPLQDIAHNPGNQLSVKHRAEFVLENGAWKLNSIE